MTKEVTALTILTPDFERNFVFLPTTSKKISVPNLSITQEKKKQINQDIYLNCMYLKI